ncbi:hypothetical protein L1987_09657 [Smallanthus sonchifolius]|uniref:Uncharacterized protein n=1 Tax=Smallanthus sonchifolius TaxID=185202 RepID=A0ACB9JPZ9_9ASTR|nr:hypothetical protein L1987_09657 [Smallanthus sonchifolius]
MAGKDDSLQSISTRLDGKNYTYWSYVMKNFLRGKNMWGYVTGTKGKPTDKFKAAEYALALDTWETDNSKVITWINNSVSQSIGIQLAKYDTAKQNEMSIQDFYGAMSDLWDQLTLTESAALNVFKPYIDRREEQRLVQFLMALRSDFEGLRGTILHRSPLPTVDSVVHELIAEETRLKSQVDKGPKVTTTPDVFAVPPNQPRQGAKVAFDECAFCKGKNNGKSQCPLLLSRRNSNLQKPPQQNRSCGQFLSRTSTSAGSFGSSSWTFKPPQFTAAATPPYVEMNKPPSALDPQVFEQFRQFLAANPTVMSAAGLSLSGTLGVLGQLQTCDISDCCGCKLAKFYALTFTKSISHFVVPFNIVHYDVWGPSLVSTKGGSRYYVSFIYDYTRYTWVYLMKRRSEFFDIYKTFRAYVQMQHSTVIKCFRRDLGGEYTSNDFTQLLTSDGTIHQSSGTDTPQQNGVAERKHRHLMETARSFLLSTEVPSVFWGEALLTAQHVINRIPTSHNDVMSPFESLFDERPDYGELQNIDPFASNIDVPTSDVPVSSVDPNMPSPDTSVAHDVPIHEPSTSSGTDIEGITYPREAGQMSGCILILKAMKLSGMSDRAHDM